MTWLTIMCCTTNTKYNFYPQNHTATAQQNLHLNSIYFTPCLLHLASKDIGQQLGHIKSSLLNYALSLFSAAA